MSFLGAAASLIGSKFRGMFGGKAPENNFEPKEKPDVFGRPSKIRSLFGRIFLTTKLPVVDSWQGKSYPLRRLRRLLPTATRKQLEEAQERTAWKRFEPSPGLTV